MMVMTISMLAWCLDNPTPPHTVSVPVFFFGNIFRIPIQEKQIIIAKNGGGNNYRTAQKSGLDIPGKEWENYWLPGRHSCGDCKFMPG